MVNHSIAKIVCTGNEIEAYRDCGPHIGIDMYLVSAFQGPLVSAFQGSLGGRTEKDLMTICLEDGDVFTFVAYEMTAVDHKKYDLSTLILVCENGKIHVSPKSIIDENYAFEVIIEDGL